MSKNYHPNASLSFIEDNLIKSGKINPDSRLQLGNTISYVKMGDKPLHKRIILITSYNEEVNFEQATMHFFNALDKTIYDIYGDRFK